MNRIKNWWKCYENNTKFYKIRSSYFKLKILLIFEINYK